MITEGVRQPDFFIVGAPKCGTSALAGYLREHPDCFMCWPKEPLFFCEDLAGIVTGPGHALGAELAHPHAVPESVTVAKDDLLAVNPRGEVAALDLPGLRHRRQIVALGREVAGEAQVLGADGQILVVGQPHVGAKSRDRDRADLTADFFDDG